MRSSNRSLKQTVGSTVFSAAKGAYTSITVAARCLAFRLNETATR